MVRLTRINHIEFYLNSDLIEFIEVTPDTVITTVNGSKVMVSETADEVVRRIMAFRREVQADAQPVMVRSGEEAAGN
jgi:flagellar protein FlbD